VITLELRELRTFCAVIETGSFSKASKLVHLTQPTVSLQIKALENYLGTCLINRSMRDCVPTESGKVFYKYAKNILSLCDEAVQSVCDVSNLSKGTLRIGASTSVGEYILPSQLASFKKIYSCVDIFLKIANTVEIIEDVAKGYLEIGIVGAKIEQNNLIFKEFFQDSLVLIVASDHPWASQEKIDIEKLKEESFLLLIEGSGTRITLEKQLEEVGIKEKDLNINMVLGTTEAVKKAVISGLGVSIVPKMTIFNEAALRQIKEVKIDGHSFFMTFYIVYDPDKFRSKFPEAFLEHMLE
jgi:DNA-binding transcriptional LysR family regulator